MFDTITIPLGRAAAYGTLQVDTNAFAAHVQRHIYEYGLRQILNDAMADKKDDDGQPLPRDVIIAKAQKRLDTLLSGELRVVGAGEPVDPVEREWHGLIRDSFIAQFRKNGEWGKFPKGADRFMYVVNKRRVARHQAPLADFPAFVESVANAPAVMAMRKEAERRVRDMAKADLADLV